MTPRRPAPARVARVAAAWGGAVGLVAALSACAGFDGANLARQACAHVDRSLALYQASLSAGDDATAETQRAQASAQLRAAMPIASAAAGQAGQYQALMATLAESDHLPESRLVHALTLQCAAAENGGETPLGPVTTAVSPPTRPPPIGH